MPLAGALDQNGNYAIEDVPAGEAQIGVVSRDPDIAAKKAQVMSMIARVKGRGKTGGQENGRDSPPPQAAPAPTSAKKKWVQLPKDVAFPDRSGITTTIQPGENTFNIELK
jgi:hypothetical protein